MNSAIYQYYPLKGERLSCIVCGYHYRKDAPLSTLQKHLRVKHNFSIRKPLSSTSLEKAIKEAKEPVFSSYVAPGVYVPLVSKSNDQKNSSPSSLPNSTQSKHESKSKGIPKPKSKTSQTSSPSVEPCQDSKNAPFIIPEPEFPLDSVDQGNITLQKNSKSSIHQVLNPDNSFSKSTAQNSITFLLNPTHSPHNIKEEIDRNNF